MWEGWELDSALEAKGPPRGRHWAGECPCEGREEWRGSRKSEELVLLLISVLLKEVPGHVPSIFTDPHP